jgi:hypothetical protein
MLLAVEGRASRHPPEQTDVELVIRVPGRWLRLFAAYGTPPGSNIGLWHTQMSEVHGWNLRIGRRYVGPCMTLLAHTRPSRPDERVIVR